MLFKYEVILITLIALFDYSSTENETLLCVQSLFRHGERLADKGLAKLEASLTEEGKDEMLVLGQYLRDRYSSFLSSADPSRAFFMSSDVERTIESASLVAAGLYGLNSTSFGKNGVVTIRTIPKEYDRFIQLDHKCPKLTGMINTTNHAWLQSFIDTHKDFIDAYEENTKDFTMRDTSLDFGIRFVLFHSFYETAAYNFSQNLPVDTWALPYLVDDGYAKFTLNLTKSLVLIPEERRLSGGPMLDLVRGNFDSPNGKEIFLYSGHDRNLYAFMSLLDIYDPLVQVSPPAAAALILELHQDVNGGKVLKIFYRNSSSTDPYKVIMPSCGNHCSWSTFKEVTNGMIPVDYEAECQSPDSYHADPFLMALVPSLFGLFCFTIFGAIIFLFRKGKRSRGVNYNQI